MPPMPSTPPQPPGSDRWQRFRSASVRGFHTYANWLVSISWRRFALLSLALLVATAIVQDLPPFRWSYTERVTVPRVVTDPEEPAPPKRPARPSKSPGVTIEKPKGTGPTEGVDISIDESGVRITPKRRDGASSPAAGASGAAGHAASAAGPGASGAGTGKPVIDIRLPPGATGEGVREAVAEARRVAEESIREAANEARETAEEAAREAAAAAEEAAGDARAARRQRVVYEPQERVRVVRLGDSLMELAFLWILGSGVIKFTYKRQIQAEAQAAQAVETAEAEALKRQVVEARMAAMQAQVEPHFLFNTLASIEHLIQTDPQRASQMQRNLIALLRASMPTMRETNDGGVRDLGRELSVIRPYLEILKVRMEERLTTEIDVPEGLMSAEFPPMMVQTLVENAIKHGLEPKPEGGHLMVKAEIVHGKLAVTVSDTGLGFGRAATAGTGVGLANIRERLQLLYGPKAALTISENPGGGTRAVIAVPYKPVEGASA